MGTVFFNLEIKQKRVTLSVLIYEHVLKLRIIEMRVTGDLNI